jgi:hypothetical protein
MGMVSDVLAIIAVLFSHHVHVIFPDQLRTYDSVVRMAEGDTTTEVRATEVGVRTEKRGMCGVAPETSGFDADRFGVTTDLTVRAEGNLLAYSVTVWGG